MSTPLTTADTRASVPTTPLLLQSYLTIQLGSQRFALAVDAIREVIDPLPLTPVPLAPATIAGLLAMDGQVVPVIRLRTLLGIAPDDATAPTNELVIVTDREERFALMVDRVEDVQSLPLARCEPLPATMDPAWRGMATGVFPLAQALLVVLDIAGVIASLSYTP